MKFFLLVLFLQMFLLMVSAEGEEVESNRICRNGKACTGTGGSFSKPKCACCNRLGFKYAYTGKQNSACGSGCLHYFNAKKACATIKCEQQCKEFPAEAGCIWDSAADVCKVKPNTG